MKMSMKEDNFVPYIFARVMALGLSLPVGDLLLLLPIHTECLLYNQIMILDILLCKVPLLKIH